MAAFEYRQALEIRDVFNRHDVKEDMNHGARMDVAVRQIVGKRLTFDELTGKKANVPEA